MTMRAGVIAGTVSAVFVVATVAVTAQRGVRNVALKPVMPKIAEAARPLPLSAVRLTGGPLERAQKLDAEYLLKLEPDRRLSF